MNRIAKTAAALTAGAALALAAPLAASAHVSVDPGQAAAGSYAVITVKVPNESETATTDRVELTLPADTPFTSVRYVPVAGWTAQLVTTTLPKPVKVGETTITEAVTSVVWTADAGTGIADGELELFPVSVGPVPEVGSLVLPAKQTYSDGTVSDWNSTDADAEHPAPVLYVNDAPPAGDHHADSDGDEPTVSASSSSADSTDVLARVLGIGGLVVGVVGIVLAIASRRPARAAK